MALDFPNAPVPNQIFDKWQWDGQKWGEVTTTGTPSGDTVVATEIAVRPPFSGMLIPYYLPFASDPYSDANCQLLLDLMKQYHDVPVLIVLNPASGPGTVADANYTNFINMLHGAGGKVCGYVATTNGTRPPGDVRTDITRWQTLYPAVDGIFLDEMPWDTGPGNVGNSYVLLYESYTDFCHGGGLYPVIGNPGTNQQPAWFATKTADIIIVHEDLTWPSEASMEGNFIGGHADYPYTERAALVYNRPSLETSLLATLRKNVQWVYVTNDNLTGGLLNPWDTLPTYLSDLFAALRPSNSGGAAALGDPVTVAHGGTGVTTEAAAPWLLKTGGSVTGALSLNPPLDLASGGSGATSAAAAPWYLKTGGVISGQVTLNPNAQAVPIGSEQLRVAGNSGTVAAIVRILNWGQPTYLAMRSYGGSSGSPSATPNTQFIGGLQLEGYDGSVGQIGSAIFAVARETWSGTVRGTGLVIQTTPPGSATLTDAVRIGQGLIVGALGNFNQDPGTGAIYQTGPHTINWNTATAVQAPPDPTRTALQIVAPDGKNTGVVIDAYANGGPVVSIRGSRGTEAAPTATQSGDSIGYLEWHGRTPTAHQSVAYISAAANETFTGTARGSRLEFATTTTSTNSQVTRAVIGQGLVVGGSIANDPGAGAIYAAGSIALVPPGSAPVVRLQGASLTWILYHNTADVNNFYLFNEQAGNARLHVSPAGVCSNISGTWQAFSDARLKRNIVGYTAGLAEIRQLTPKTFNYNEIVGLDDSTQHYGLVAQDVEPVMPELVGEISHQPFNRETREFEGEAVIYKTVDPGRLIYALLNAVKELAAEVDALKGAQA